jgi:hypothetical protein
MVKWSNRGQMGVSGLSVPAWPWAGLLCGQIRVKSGGVMVKWWSNGQMVVKLPSIGHIAVGPLSGPVAGIAATDNDQAVK